MAHHERSIPDAERPPLSFTYAGATLVADEEGRPPRVFLLVHGIGMGRTVFGDLAEHLRGHGRVVRVDLPGYGEAPEPARTLTMERTADLVAAFVRERGLHRAPGGLVLVGHSMGTQVVAEVAARHPGLADRVVLVAPTVNARERGAGRQLRRLVQDLAVESPKVIAIGAREYLRAGPNLHRKLRAMLAHRPEEAYPRIAVPALVLRGAEDPVSPLDWCRDVVRALPDGRLTEVPDHGHETMIRDAAPTASRIIDFVGSR
ncbi:alpha/beta fold hydrolase [Microbacterium sp. 18062]|uniref:alpha/beta fold hydrolase n=1 Tax=Microbacterium sp. 18062 TaxID=2681410 RepID=UPI001F3D95FF|nr:alpha/beta fold hydrolase [Microbacterium sp. 18062]